jgi:hypothetical protein
MANYDRKGSRPPPSVRRHKMIWMSSFRMNDAKVLIPHKRTLFNRKFLSLGNFYKIWCFRSYAQVSLNTTSLTRLGVNYVPWCVSFKDLAACVIDVKTTNCTVRMLRTHSHKGISSQRRGLRRDWEGAKQLLNQLAPFAIFIDSLLLPPVLCIE